MYAPVADKDSKYDQSKADPNISYEGSLDKRFACKKSSPGGLGFGGNAVRSCTRVEIR